MTVKNRQTLGAGGRCRGPKASIWRQVWGEREREGGEGELVFLLLYILLSNWARKGLHGLGLLTEADLNKWPASENRTINRGGHVKAVHLG